MIARYKTLLLGFAFGVMMAALAAVGLEAPAYAQQTGQQTVVPAQMNSADSLRVARAENEALTRILSSIESIDTARQNELIQWIITDRSIRSRVISALRKSGYRIAPNSIAELTVTQKPPTPDDQDMGLLRVVIESIGLYGEPTIRRVLGPDLYDRIQSRQGYEFTLVSTEPAQQKIQFVQMDASLFGGDIIFKSGFGFGINVGDDYIGYPFWLPGTIGTYGLIRRGTTDFRIGIEWPLGQSGTAPFVLSQGLQLRERKLTGAMAFSAEIKQELNLLSEQSGKIHFGLEFRNAFTPSFNNMPAFAGLPQYRTNHFVNGRPAGSTDSLYYLGLSAHAYASYSLPNSVLQGAYVQLGAGMHSIQPMSVGDDPTDPTNTNLVLYDRMSFFDPFVKLGYIHAGESGDDYGISVQYSNTLLTDGWVKLFPWLQLEAKYAAVVFRDPQKWEWKDYVIVSPKLTLNF
ncbi:MAG TPA: hypothetical protein VG537_02225 [Candidatus Kapabacteria bacterium]|jgi:hypothetical protein|nr:hypothetical protein [Candidatus Kapabacteria bacterium]